MEYRINRRTGDRISVIGLGTAYLGSAKEETALAMLKKAREEGINFVDLAAGNRKAIEYVGKAFQNCREDMIYQVHFGADYSTGEYGWTTDCRKVREQVEWMLSALHTDYIDYGFMHCLDEEKDLEAYQKNGVLDYLLSMKEQGIVRHLGLSTHNPVLANRVLDLGLIDQLMFSINPAYDQSKGEYANGTHQERRNLYRRCEMEGVGITVMKPFSGGQLLDAASSPYGEALTQEQCLQYVLDQPGVLCAVPGAADLNDIERLAAFCEAPEEKRDYSILSKLEMNLQNAGCVYCSHCHPCPAGLNISLINKYYDLYLQGDQMAADHYQKLEKHASDCLYCGHCDSRCPFRTEPMERMKKISEVFG